MHMNKSNNNSHKDFLYSQRSEGSFGFLKWILKAELIILSIIFIMIILYRLIPYKVIFEAKYTINKKFISSSYNAKFDSNIIKESVNNNNSLSQEEKNYINLYLIDEIEENISYIDINSINTRLRKLKTVYNQKYNNGIVGKYNSLFNQISFYKPREEADKTFSKVNKTRLSFNNCNKEAYFHELNHMLSKNSLNTIYSKSIFLESINELFTREYYYAQNVNKEKYRNGYDDYIVLAYSMSELLPEDVIRKYKFDNNESILIESILEIDNNIGEAYNLIISANNIIDNQNDRKSYLDYINSYKYFYKEKYGKDMSDDLNILFYFYNSPFQTNEERKIVRDYLNLKNDDEIINVIPKGYYSKKYKENNQKIKVEFLKDGQKKSIEIDNKL